MDEVNALRETLATALRTLDGITGRYAVSVLNKRNVIEAERALKAEFLDLAISVAIVGLGDSDVALHLLCGKIPSAGKAGVGPNPQIEYDFCHHVQGVLLDRGGPKKAASATNEYGGVYEGRDIFLLATGKLAFVTYTGTWSDLPGATNHWVTTIDETTALDIADQGYKVLPLVASLQAAMENQLRGNSEMAARANKGLPALRGAIESLQAARDSLRAGKGGVRL
jgi:hypothetical protein